jgi:hypothetical protein
VYHKDRLATEANARFATNIVVVSTVNKNKINLFMDNFTCEPGGGRPKYQKLQKHDHWSKLFSNVKIPDHRGSVLAELQSSTLLA